MKPKFIKRIHLNIPKPLIPKIDDFDKTAVQITNKAMIKAVEQIDDAIFNEIVAIARSEGIDDIYLLDKMNIVSALEKQIPKKPTPHKVEGGKIKIGNGWWCEGTTVYRCPCCNEFISRTYDYCYKCGQALDWDKE